MTPDEIKLIRDTSVLLEGGYSRHRLSEELANDARCALSMGLEEISWRFDDLSSHAERLETVLSVAIKAIEAAERDVEDIKEQLQDLDEKHREQIRDLADSYEARVSVEDSLHRDGITEDPDVDGGLLG